LHETLPLHDPETLMRIAALSARRLQYRPARFLDLKKEWIIVASEKQCQIAACADAPHANNFYCCVLKPIALEQLLSIRLQRFLVLLDESRVALFEILNIFLEMVDDRRIVLNRAMPIYDLSELGNDSLRVLRAGLLLLLGQPG
jgi:hypothetical protein